MRSLRNGSDGIARATPFIDLSPDAQARIHRSREPKHAAGRGHYQSEIDAKERCDSELEKMSPDMPNVTARRSIASQDFRPSSPSCRRIGLIDESLSIGAVCIDNKKGAASSIAVLRASPRPTCGCWGLARNKDDATTWVGHRSHRTPAHSADIKMALPSRAND